MVFILIAGLDSLLAAARQKRFELEAKRFD